MPASYLMDKKEKRALHARGREDKKGLFPYAKALGVVWAILDLEGLSARAKVDRAIAYLEGFHADDDH